MIKLAIKLATLAPVLMALSTAPSLTPALAAGGGGGGGEASSAMDPGPSYPPSSYPKRSGTKATHKVKKTNKQSGIDDPSFAQGYRAAYATIYDRNDYAAAIEQLKSLGHDDHPNVANRTGQPRSSAISFEPDRCDLRDRLRGVSFLGGGTGKAAGHRPRLLSVAATRFSGASACHDHCVGTAEQRRRETRLATVD